MRKRDLLILIGALVLAAVLAARQLLPRDLAAGSWGLSFQQSGQIPRGPASRQELARFDAAYVDTGTEPVLYLTFDAGYENGYTAQILDILKKHQVKAAFFLVGNYIEKNADLVRRMVVEGHTVGNHTMNHPDMSKLSDKTAFARELQSLEECYAQVTGETMPKYYRPPQGLYSQENLQMAKELGYKTVFWSLAYADWDNKAQPSREQALDKLLTRTHPGAVILLHATSKTNAQVLDALLTQWKAQGYRFETLDALFSDSHFS